MIQRWVYRRCSSVHGPLTLDELRAAAFLGFLRPDDLVRDMATEHWVLARSIESLRTAFPCGQAVQGIELPGNGNPPAAR